MSYQLGNRVVSGIDAAHCGLVLTCSLGKQENRMTAGTPEHNHFQGCLDEPVQLSPDRRTGKVWLDVSNSGKEIWISPN